MSSTGNVRVSGGILNDQMLTGSQRYFMLTGADAANAISDGTVTIPFDYGDETNIPPDYTIAEGDPVPNSAVEHAFFQIQQRATIAVIGVDDAAVSFALENTSMGWEEVSLYGGNAIVTTAADAMTAAIQALGTVTTPTGDVDLSAATVTEVTFKLSA